MSLEASRGVAASLVYKVEQYLSVPLSKILITAEPIGLYSSDIDLWLFKAYFLREGHPQEIRSLETKRNNFGKHFCYLFSNLIMRTLEN